jgi:hypothetical protein
MRMGKDPAALPATDATSPNLNPSPSWEVSRWRSESKSPKRRSKSRSPIRMRELKPRPVSAQPNRWTPQPASRALRGGGAGGGGGTTAAERPGRPRSAMRRSTQKETSSNTQQSDSTARVRSPPTPATRSTCRLQKPSQPASWTHGCADATRTWRSRCRACGSPNFPLRRGPSRTTTRRLPAAPPRRRRYHAVCSTARRATGCGRRYASPRATCGSPSPQTHTAWS